MSQRPVGRYNIFGEWLEKYDRRVKKISENPNPMLMESNLILYQVLENLQSGPSNPKNQQQKLRLRK